MGTDLIARAVDLQARLDAYRERVERRREWGLPDDAAIAAEGARLRVEAVAMYKKLAIAAGHFTEGMPQ